MMNTNELIEFLTTAGRQAIESQDEFVPTVVLQSDGVEVAVLAVEGSPVDALAQFLSQYLAAERKPIEAISFTVDAYMEHGTADELNARRDRKGTDLSKRFRKGDPTVSECLMISAVFADGEERSVQLPYTRAGGKIVWGKMIDAATELQGRVPHVLRGAILLSQNMEALIEDWQAENN